MLLRRCALLATIALVSACATLPPADLLDDARLHADLRALLCRLSPACGGIHLQVLDRSPEQAEMFPDGRLQVNLGLLLATRSESEIAFVLAHELAHRTLRHRFTRDPQARTRLEIAADLHAARNLLAAGLDPGAGAALLQRLLDVERELEGASGAESVAQIEARLAALRAWPAAVPGEDAWQVRLAPYRSR